MARKQLLNIQQQHGTSACNDILQKLNAAVSNSQVVDALPPVIYYASRTHSQLSQVVQELKNTAYRPNICTLGSRDQLCINSEVIKAPAAARTSICRTKVFKKSCEFHAGKDAARTQMRDGDILDIEELVKFGEKLKACPFYMSRELQQKADIIFLPYNYLIDPIARKSQNIDVSNAIIIFDEEGICTDASSFEITTSEINGCAGEASLCMDLLLKSPSASASSTDFKNLRDMMHNLAREILKLSLSGPAKDFIKSGDYIYELFQKININFESASSIMRHLEVGLDLLSQDTTQKKKSKFNMVAMLAALKVVFRDNLRTNPNSINVVSRSYKVHVSEMEAWATTSGRKFNFWCFHAGVAMADLISPGVRSTILASGTLSPLSSFVHEMGIPFKYQLENPHVISKSQVQISVVPKGPGGCKLSSAYENRGSSDYVSDMGDAIVSFCRNVPDGVLIFFPSYGVMQKSIDIWKKKIPGKSCMWEQLARMKEPVVEPKGKLEFVDAIATFYAKLKDKRLQGAVFFAVCRGKASEGLDFSDAKGRAVIICGIPYPAAKDPKVLLKKRFLDDSISFKTSSNLSGHEWYQQQASRAVNQAIGRVIRHRKDYGAILLCDERFGLPYNINQLSLWVRPFVKVYNNFNDAEKNIISFFKGISNTKILKELQNAPVVKGSDLKTGHFNLLKDSAYHAILNPPKKVVRSDANINIEYENLEIKKDPTLHNTISRRKMADTTKKRVLDANDTERPKARSYLDLVKQNLSLAENREFQTCVKNYKAKVISVNILIESITEIFCKNQRMNGIILLEGFQEYIPRKHQKLFQNHIEKMKGINKI